MKLEQLEQFIKVIDFGSISKAAMKMHMAQSTLSTSLKKFEEELGCQLIERDSKGVSLTPKGVEVYNQGKNIYEQIEDMKKTAISDTQGEEILSVSNNCTIIGKDIFIELYKKYHKQKAKFNIQDCSSSDTIQHVFSGETEVGLLRFPLANKAVHMRNMKRLGLDYHQIAKKVICAVIGKENPFYRLNVDKIKIEHLTKFPFVGYYQEEADIVYENILPKKNRIKENITISGVDHLKEVIRQTDAFTLDVYKAQGFNSEDRKDIKYIPLDPTVYSEFGWIHKRNRKVSQIAEEYIYKITVHLKKHEKMPKEFRYEEQESDK